MARSSARAPRKDAKPSSAGDATAPAPPETLKRTELEGEVHRLREELERRDARLNLAARRAEERLREVDLELVDSREQIKALAEETSTLDRELRLREDELDEVEKALEDVELRFQEQERELEKAANDLGSLERRADAWRQEKDETLAAFEEEKKFHTDTRDELRKVQSVRNELRDEVAGLYERLEGKEKEVDNLKCRWAETEAEFERDRERLKQEARDEALRSAGEVNEQKLRDLSTALEAVEEERAELGDQLERLKKEAIDREHDLAELEKRQSGDSNTAVADRVAELEEQLETRDAAWQDIEDLVRRSQAERDTLLQQLEVSNQRVAELEDSLESSKMRSREIEAKAKLEKLREEGGLAQAGDYAVAELRMELGED